MHTYTHAIVNIRHKMFRTDQAIVRAIVNLPNSRHETVQFGERDNARYIRRDIRSLRGSLTSVLCMRITGNHGCMYTIKR